MKNRIVLLIGYWFLASVVVYISAPFGDGSFFPLFVFTSWPGLIMRILNNPETGRIYAGLIEGGLLIILYYVCLIMLVSKLVLVPNKTLRFIPGAIHLSGGLAFFLISDEQRIQSDWPVWMKSYFIASYVISLALALLWLSIDWRLANKSRMKAEHSTAK